MTKTRNERKGQGDRAHSADAATESSSPMAFTEDLGHETERQPCQEQPLTEFNMAIRELAYYKWEAAGFPPGDGFDFWLEAEREVKANRPDSTPAPE